jgi:hypothetical protein
MLGLHVACVYAAALAASATAPDLVVDFGSGLLRGPKARPATRAVAGLLNGGPEFGAKFLNPLRMGNYRGQACQSPSAYRAMVQAGATNIQCDMDEMAANCTALPPNLNDTSMCSVWPGRNGNWTPWEAKIAALVAAKIGPETSWGVWNEPNDGFWAGCTSGCATPDPAWLAVWNRTVRAIRVRIHVPPRPISTYILIGQGDSPGTFLLKTRGSITAFDLALSRPT